MKTCILSVLLAGALACDPAPADDNPAEPVTDDHLAIAADGDGDSDGDGDGDGAVQLTPLIEFEDTGLFTRIHPTKNTIGEDGKLYFNTSLGIVHRIDEDGVLERVSILPNAGGIPDDDFTFGIAFDRGGDLYVSNITGVYRITAQDLMPDLLAQPVAAAKIADLPAGLLSPTGLAADTQGNLYQADIAGGAIYKIDIATGDGALWFIDPALQAPQVLPSNNLFGFGFGITDMSIDSDDEFLYFGTQETHRIYRIGIDQDGSAGDLQELAHVPNLAFNGISLDAEEDAIYFCSPFENFENGIQVAENRVAIAGSIWMIDIEDLEEDGVATPVELIRDVALGTTVDVTRGHRFGDDGDNEDRLYISDGSFDTFFWPNGDPNGTPLPDEVPEPGIPFPQNAYHAAIRVVELDD